MLRSLLLAGLVATLALLGGGCGKKSEPAAAPKEMIPIIPGGPSVGGVPKADKDKEKPKPPTAAAQ
jgi:hypothetical protein